MLRNLGYFLILGKPLVLYLGILTLTSFLITALIGFLNYKGNHKTPFKWHPRMVILSFTFAIIHALLVMFHYF